MPEMAKVAFTLWFTGLPCSGKSTLAKKAEKEIKARGFKSELLDGEEIRKSLSKDLGFTKQDRDENVRRIGFICNLLTRNGIIAIASVISPYRAARDELAARIKQMLQIANEAVLNEHTAFDEETSLYHDPERQQQWLEGVEEQLLESTPDKDNS